MTINCRSFRHGGGGRGSGGLPCRLHANASSPLGTADNAPLFRPLFGIGPSVVSFDRKIVGGQISGDRSKFDPPSADPACDGSALHRVYQKSCSFADNHEIPENSYVQELRRSCGEDIT